MSARGEEKRGREKGKGWEGGCEREGGREREKEREGKGDCVCVCVCERERERKRERAIATARERDSVPLVIDEDVGALDVTVEDVLRVEVCEPLQERSR